ncbi:MAG: SDR family NAD(P)-dependent oxidoreductase [Burkholderiaceae bacterium]
MALRGMAGKVAIVTGAAQGLGAAVVRRLLEEGVQVCAVDINASALDASVREQSSTRLCAQVADVTREADVDAFVGATVGRFGALHYFVNNAGLLGPDRRIDETSLAEFEQLFAANVRSVFLGLRAGIRQMLAQGTGGAIVNVASMGGLRSSAGRALYGSTKRAVIGLSNSAALETARQGIRVNAIAPGVIDTPMGDAGDVLRTLRGQPDHLLARPMPRKADPAEVAALVAWLLSDEASFVNAATYSIDGGASA